MKTTRYLRSWCASALAAMLALVVLGCDGGFQTPAAPTPGDSDFVSAPPGGGGYGFAADDSDGARSAGAPNEAGTQDPSAAAPPSDPTREIEEADIVKVEGNLLYALNRYRGLFIIDITDPASPKKLGHLDTYGYPVEMYIRDGRAYLILTNYFQIWALAADGSKTEIGSSVQAVDISVPSAPELIGRFHVPGRITDTRVVGDVLYAVSNRYSWYSYYYPTGDWADDTTVMSINIANPDFIHQVDSHTFPRDGGWDNSIHVTTEAIYVATSTWDSASNQYATNVRYVNISDPDGQLSLGAQFQVEGTVRDRWQLDYYDGVFRIVTADGWWGNGQPKVTTFQVINPYRIRKMGQVTLQLPRPESLTAARFDKGRAYIVTYERVDPLFIVDLTDPAYPRQRGELEMPGWLDHIVPRGDRLVALGHDDSGGETHLAVSLFDVSNMDTPVLLDRVTFGEGWGWITDERDNFEKVFKVLDQEGLILVPFQQYAQTELGYWRSQGGVQLIDFTTDKLTERGYAAHAGYIRRALIADGRLMTLSDQRLQVLDIDDRDNPRLIGDLSLSRSVAQFTLLGDHAIQLTGDWYSGQTSIVVVPRDEPDLGEPVAEIVIDAPYGRLFTHDDHVFLLYRDPAADWKLTLQSIDLSDPGHPRLRGKLQLPETFSYYGYYYGWWRWSYWYYEFPRYDSVVQVDGDKLVFHAVRSYWYGASASHADELMVVDLSTPGQPELASHLHLIDKPWVASMKAVTGGVIFTHLEQAGTDEHGKNYVKYYLNRLNLADPYRPRLSQAINVPGVVLSADLRRGRLYTMDFQYRNSDTGYYYNVDRSINVLTLYGNNAVLRGRVTLPDNAGQVSISGTRALFTKQRNEYDQTEGRYVRESWLQGVDLSSPQNPRLTQEIKLPVPYASLWMVNGDKAILGTWWYVSGLMLYDIGDLDAPRFDRHVRTQGWVSDLTRDGNDLFLATGPYGVKRISLAD